METLQETNPLVYKELQNNGDFVMLRTSNILSWMDLDQQSEQLINILKEIGALLGQQMMKKNSGTWQIVFELSYLGKSCTTYP